MKTFTDTPPIPKHILNQAKAFLCWDYDTNLTIQLIPLDDEVAYFFPPTKERSTILVFYPKGCLNFMHSIFYLFHEVGHYEQFKNMGKIQSTTSFADKIQHDKGIDRLAFENEAWELGAVIFQNFLNTTQLDNVKLGKLYRQFQQQCLQSYLD